MGEWDRGCAEAEGGASWALPGPRPEYELGECEDREDPWLEPENAELDPPDNVLELLCGWLGTFLTTIFGFGTMARFLSLLSSSTVLKQEEASQGVINVYIEMIEVRIYFQCSCCDI